MPKQETDNPMPEKESKSDSKKSALQFVAALVITLTGVSLGSILVMRHEGPRPSDKPTALGHKVPRVNQDTQATNNAATNHP